MVVQTIQCKAVSCIFKLSEQHRKHVQAYRQSLDKENMTEERKTMTDEEMWERLDELEKIELERREMHKYIKIFFM